MQTNFPYNSLTSVHPNIINKKPNINSQIRSGNICTTIIAPITAIINPTISVNLNLGHPRLKPKNPITTSFLNISIISRLYKKHLLYTIQLHKKNAKALFNNIISKNNIIRNLTFSFYFYNPAYIFLFPDKKVYCDFLF